MGKTGRLIYAYDKDNLEEARGTIPVITNVLRHMTRESSHNIIGDPVPDDDIKSYLDEREQDQNYLDGLFGSVGLQRFTDVSMDNKKRRASGNEEGSESSGNMSALTGVSAHSVASVWTQAGNQSVYSARSRRGAREEESRTSAGRGRGRGSQRGMTKMPRVDATTNTSENRPQMAGNGNGTSTMVGRRVEAHQGSLDTRITSPLTTSVEAEYETKLRALEQSMEKRTQEQERREKVLNDQIAELVQESKERASQMTRVEKSVERLVSVGSGHDSAITSLETQLRQVLSLLQGRTTPLPASSNEPTLVTESQSAQSQLSATFSTHNSGGGKI